MSFLDDVYDSENFFVSFHPDEGVKHPELTYEQQTKLFCAVAELLAKQAREDCVAVCEDAGFAVEIRDDYLGRPEIAGMPEEVLNAMFQFGRACQANRTIAAFLAHLGTPGYEDELMINMIPIPEDLSGLDD